MNIEANTAITKFNQIEMFSNYALNVAGCISISGTSSIDIDNSLFYENIAVNEVSVLHFDQAADSYVKNSIFRNNEVERNGNTIKLVSSNADFYNVTLENNYALEESMGMLIEGSYITIDMSTFRNDHSRLDFESLLIDAYVDTGKGGFFYLNDFANLIMTNSNFEN